MHTRMAIAHVGLLSLLSACSDSGIMTSSMEDDEGAYAEDGDYGDGGSADAGGSGDGDDFEPEEEDDFLSLRPATTSAYVFVANKVRNTVTRIGVPGLDVITTEVGVDPHVVVTTEDYETAVVFNRGSDDVSIIDADTLDVISVEVRDNFNQMKLSPDGRWVICYYDAAAAAAAGEEGGDSTGAQSFNEISLVNIETLAHVPMVVGFNPRDIQFTDSGDLAVVVSDAYLALIDLTVDEPAPDRIQIDPDTIEPPKAEEVLLSPDGSYAIVRQFAATDLIVVDLDTQDVTRIEVGDNPTDLDITPDGGQAVAVARGSGELWVYDLADPFAEPTVIPLPEGEVFGSVLMSPDGDRGLLYSTATGISRYGSWERGEGAEEIDVHSLVKPVSGMSISPTGGTALVFHDKDNGEDVDNDSPFYNAWALTMIDLSDHFANPLELPAKPTAYANADDGETGFFIMDGELLLEVLHYDSLLYDEVPLKSNPVYLGTLPDTRAAYISQEHDLGRISFYDAETELLQTITGFELNAGISH